MSDTRTYRRSRDGKRWHRDTCPSAKTLPRWDWAYSHNGETVVYFLGVYGLADVVKPCRKCSPELTP